jgi:hypothetical protein
LGAHRWETLAFFSGGFLQGESRDSALCLIALWRPAGLAR